MSQGLLDIENDEPIDGGDSVEQESIETVADNPPKNRHTILRWFRRGVKTLVLLLAIAVASIYFLYGSMQREPEFYQAAIQISQVELEEDGDRFETKVLDLQNDARDQGIWSHVFHEDEVNGWLAVDCPEKFPELIPAFVQSPRIRFSESEFQIVFRYQSRRVSAVVNISGDVFIAEPGGELAVRIKEAKSGLLPLPVT